MKFLTFRFSKSVSWITLHLDIISIDCLLSTIHININFRFLNTETVEIDGLFGNENNENKRKAFHFPKKSTKDVEVCIIYIKIIHWIILVCNNAVDISIYLSSLQTISSSDYQVSAIVCCYIQPIFVHDVRAVLCWRAGHASTALPKPEEVPSNQSCVSADTIFLIELFICLSA